MRPLCHDHPIAESRRSQRKVCFVSPKDSGFAKHQPTGSPCEHNGEKVPTTSALNHNDNWPAPPHSTVQKMGCGGQVSTYTYKQQTRSLTSPSTSSGPQRSKKREKAFQNSEPELLTNSSHNDS